MTKTDIEYCEHDEIAVACLDCMAMPQKVAPRPQPKQKATKSPTSERDLIAPLNGTLDMSLPVTDVAAVVGNDWVGAHAFPHGLRRSGWVYLRTAEALAARVKAKKVEWREVRTVGADELGAGMVIVVDPATWDEAMNIELGRLARRQIKGYRYLRAQDDGTVVHYSGGKPVEELEVDPDDDETSETIC